MSNAAQRRQAKSLKNPTPVELPSGRWRCQVTVNGKRVSIVEDDPKTAHAKAVAIKAEIIKAQRQPESMTVGEAVDRYLDSRDGVLSPSTLRSYRSIRKNALGPLEKMALSCLTQEAVQREINELSKSVTPKTVRNVHGLLSAMLAVYAPDLRLRTNLPAKMRHEIQIPTEEHLRKMMESTIGTPLEVPFVLAVWLGLRQSEIVGLQWDDIQNGVLHVHSAVVYGEDGPIRKGPKSYSGDRKLRIPEYVQRVLDRTPHNSESIVSISGKAIYCRFRRMCTKLGLPPYRFHDLRHVNASVLMAAGAPNKYVQERMGHSTDHMLKTVYQHVMDRTRNEVDQRTDELFSAILHTNCTQDSKKR